MNRKSIVVTLVVCIVASQISAQKRSKPRGLTEEQRIVHVLNRLGFGARPGDVERVKSMGLENYINQQLNPEKLADTLAENKVKDLAVLNMTTAELYEKYPQPGQLVRQLQNRGLLPKELAETNDKNPRENPEYRKLIQQYYKENGLEQPQRIIAELQASRILRAVYSERQLQEVMVDFWTNHFNVFAGKGADRWLLPAYDRDTIRPYALSKFSTLLQATAQSPAMLFYLDNFQSVSPNANNNRGPQMERRQQQQPQQQQRPRRGINENYARELMELHTLGVDGGYTQKDVQEVARCFTGWTIFQPRGGAAAVNALRGEAARRTPGTFFFNHRTHDDGEKIVLGHKIAAGGGINDGLKVLDILAHHPSTAKFIATKLVRHFVSDTPPPALVERVAAAFKKSDGDIRETLKAIFFSNEFNSPEAYRAKVKRPFELVISAIRTLGADTNGGPGTHQWMARMGEPLYGFQTPNGYSDAAESWVNNGGLLERMNFGVALAANRVNGTKVDLTKVAGANADKGKMIDESVKTILAGELSAATRETLMKQLDQADSLTKVVGLILGTPEFQRQ
ncbi:MAG TPA: DUF1800 domain-containing protein [Pyrinomonadaceae bacterium]|nr:DUF1800 domain-containing protein [Pyrinomonadaceae bacterium]